MCQEFDESTDNTCSYQTLFALITEVGLESSFTSGTQEFFAQYCALPDSCILQSENVTQARNISDECALASRDFQCVQGTSVVLYPFLSMGGLFIFPSNEVPEFAEKPCKILFSSCRY